MRAHEVKSLGELKNPSKLIAELKFDGRRGQIVRTEQGVDVYSSSLKSKNGLCPHLEEYAMALPPGTVLDGEFVLFKDGASKVVDLGRYGMPGQLEVHVPQLYPYDERDG